VNQNPLDLLPELCLLIGALFGLVAGLFTPRARQGRVALIAAAAAAAAVVTAGVQWAGPTRIAFDSYRVDDTTGAVRVIVAASLLPLIALLRQQFRGHARETEVYVLVLLAALGATTLAGTDDLLLLMAAYILATVPLYALIGFAKDSPGTEAAMKYYLMGALFGLIMLAGITVLFGLAGQTAYPALAAGLAHAPRGALVVGVVALVAGLAFKIGAVPAHFWVPDAAAGTTPAVAAFVTTVPKIGAFAALFRLFDGPLQDVDVDWRLLLAIVAVASMTLGNFAAFFQRDPRRLLGYSTISQVGYLLLPLVVAGRVEAASSGLLYYLAAYALSNIGAFAVVAALPRLRSLADYRGLAVSHPALAFALAVSLLGLIGTPPLAVFIGKLTAFTVAVDGDYAWLAFVAAVNTVASVFYYLRWIAPAFTRPPGNEWPSRANTAMWPQLTAYGCSLGALTLGVIAGLVLTTTGTF
jgi:NADH-quinone oxidoreductase subunit N